MARGSGSKRADAKANRERLLRAAREVLAERGLRAKITDIAARAGVGTGTVYRNYPNTEALFLEVAREMANKTSAELLEIAANVEDARECVAPMMEIGFRRVKEYGLLAIELVSGGVPPAYARVVNHKSLGNVFTLLLKRGIDQGYFRADLDVDYAVAVWFALVAPQTSKHLLERLSIDEIAQKTAEFFLAGISARPPEPDRHES